VRERRSELGREERKRRGSGVALGKSPGVLLGFHSQAGGGVGGGQEQATQLLLVTHEEDNDFAKSPLGIGDFPGRFKTALVCNI
jgi:hypothetical protein